MRQSHGTRNRPSASGARRGSAPSGRGGSRGASSSRAAQRRPRSEAPPPERYDSGSYDAHGRPYESYETEQRSGLGRKVWRVLSHNVTITIVALGVLMAVVANVSLGKGEAPKGAAAGMSTNDMLALINTADHDMDSRAADAVAAAKQRAYQQQLAAEKAAREKAKRDAKARAALAKQRAKEEAERKRRQLAATNPTVKQNKAYGKQMNALKGWGRCWPSLETLWTRESSWNERAENPSSGAYGIPQALPGDKMASAGKDWRTSTPTQIAWGLSYIKARYKDPCGAWAFWQSHHWY